MQKKLVFRVAGFATFAFHCFISLLFPDFALALDKEIQRNIDRANTPLFIECQPHRRIFLNHLCFYNPEFIARSSCESKSTGKDIALPYFLDTDAQNILNKDAQNYIAEEKDRMKPFKAYVEHGYVKLIFGPNVIKEIKNEKFATPFTKEMIKIDKRPYGFDADDLSGWKMTYNQGNYHIAVEQPRGGLSISIGTCDEK